jgi:hypothetical protein
MVKRKQQLVIVMTTLQKAAPAPAAGAEPELNDAWWGTFIQVTQQVTETAVLSDALAPATVAGLMREVLGVIRTMCRRQSDGGGFLRVYLDDHRLAQDQLTEHIYSSPPQMGETVSDWAERTFGPRRFCLIFNYAELLSDRLCQLLTQLIGPFLHQWGIPLNGLHTTTFVGNYGYTPLGIHQDNVGGNVIHFHLGPGPKTMYTWDEALYKQLTQDKPANKDIGPLLPLATAYTFGAGDIYFMPWNQYHIGYSDALSVGVTVWFDNHTNDVVFMQLLQSLRERLFDLSLARITTPEYPSNTPGHSFSEITRLVRPAALADFNQPIEVIMKNEFTHQSRRLVSNSGWKVSPTSRNPAWSVQNTEHLRLLLTSQVQLVSPFRLLPVPTDSPAMQVYCRGEAIGVLTALLPLIHELNLGSPVVTTTLLASLDAFLQPAATAFLMALYNSRTLTLTSLI